jgi:hypothetical protein
VQGILYVRRSTECVDNPGGQGVAGSNPVVPTAGRSPLVLGECPGQRDSLVFIVDLVCGSVVVWSAVGSWDQE